MCQRILISGINGVVGNELADWMCANVNHEWEICGIFSTPGSVALFTGRVSPEVRERVTPLVCDLADVGAVSKTADALAKADRCIGIHAAADVSWHRPLDEIRRTNVGASRNFAHLLRQTSNQARLIYVSSAYTRAHDWEYRNSYEASKAEGERIIRQEYADLRPTTFSCSLVVGRSHDGYISSFHGIYPLIRLIDCYAPPLIPGNRDTAIDIVPVDWVGSELGRMAERCIERNDVDDVVAVAGEVNLTLGELCAHTCNEINRQRELRGLDPHHEIPVLSFRQWRFLRRTMDVWKVEAIDPLHLERLERVIDLYEPYLKDGRTLPPKNVTRPAPSAWEYMPFVVDYWYRANHGEPGRGVRRR